MIYTGDLTSADAELFDRHYEIKLFMPFNIRHAVLPRSDVHSSHFDNTL